MTAKDINALIAEHKPDTNEISDGYHTFEELYEHRIRLFITICKLVQHNHQVWRTRTHSDGTRWDGWFLLGIGVESGEQITYHLPEKYWVECDFAVYRFSAPEYDGHTSEDVLKRLSSL